MPPGLPRPPQRGGYRIGYVHHYTVVYIVVRAILRGFGFRSALPSSEGGAGGGHFAPCQQQASYYRKFPNRWFHIVVGLVGEFV